MLICAQHDFMPRVPSVCRTTRTQLLKCLFGWLSLDPLDDMNTWVENVQVVHHLAALTTEARQFHLFLISLFSPPSSLCFSSASSATLSRSLFNGGCSFYRFVLWKRIRSLCRWKEFILTKDTLISFRGFSTNRNKTTNLCLSSREHNTSRTTFLHLCAWTSGRPRGADVGSCLSPPLRSFLSPFSPLNLKLTADRHRWHAGPAHINYLHSRDAAWILLSFSSHTLMAAGWQSAQRGSIDMMTEFTFIGWKYNDYVFTSGLTKHPGKECKRAFIINSQLH